MQRSCVCSLKACAVETTQRQGILYILAAVTGYAFLPTLVKQIQAAGLPPLDIATWRFVFATLIIWPLIALRSQRASHAPLPRLRLLLLGIMMAGAALTAFYGLERLPASTLIVLFYTYPTMVAVISLFLGERLPLQAWLALALTLVGVVLTVPDFGMSLEAATAEGGSPLVEGVALALMNALLVAVYFVLNNRMLRGHTGLAQASAWVITGALLTMMAVTLLRREVTLPADPSTWLYLLALAGVSTVMPIFCLTFGIQKLGASKAAIMGTIEPVLTILIAAVVLGERMLPEQLLGGLFVLLSVVLLQVPLRFIVARGKRKPVVGEAVQ